MERHTSLQTRTIMNTWSNSCTFDSYIIPTMKENKSHGDITRPRHIRELCLTINTETKTMKASLFDRI